MDTNEIIKATGALNIQVRGADGRLKDERDLKNLVVTVGKTFIASRMVGVAANIMSHMAVGTGTTAAAVGDTTLQTESARVALTSGANSGNVATYVCTFAAGTPASLTAITEAGIFNAASAGTLLCHTVFAAVNKDVGDTMTITWTVTIN